MAFWQKKHGKNTAFDKNHGFQDFRDYLLSLCIIYITVTQEDSARNSFCCSSQIWNKQQPKSFSFWFFNTPLFLQLFQVRQCLCFYKAKAPSMISSTSSSSGSCSAYELQTILHVAIMTNVLESHVNHVKCRE